MCWPNQKFCDLGRVSLLRSLLLIWAINGTPNWTLTPAQQIIEADLPDFRQSHNL